MKRKIVGIFIVTLLITTTNLILIQTVEADWNEGDDYNMHWPQTPDLTNTGMDNCLYDAPNLADNFLCSKTGPIKSIHIWGGFDSDNPPENGAGSITFIIKIHENIPGGWPFLDWDTPGLVVWSQTFTPSDYTVRDVSNGVKRSWYCPFYDDFWLDGETKIWQYNFYITNNAVELIEGTKYWLDISWVDKDVNHLFTWTTTKLDLQWDAAAVFLNSTGKWQQLIYPEETFPHEAHPYHGQKADLAFVIQAGEPESVDLNIIQPRNGLYLWGNKIPLASATIVIGKIVIKAEVTSGVSDVSYVFFNVTNVITGDFSCVSVFGPGISIYEWEWPIGPESIGFYLIKAEAYNIHNVKLGEDFVLMIYL